MEPNIENQNNDEIYQLMNVDYNSGTWKKDVESEKAAEAEAAKLAKKKKTKSTIIIVLLILLLLAGVGVAVYLLVIEPAQKPKPTPIVPSYTYDEEDEELEETEEERLEREEKEAEAKRLAEEVAERDELRKNDLNAYLQFLKVYSANNSGYTIGNYEETWKARLEEYGFNAILDQGSFQKEGLAEYYKLKEICTFGDGKCTNSERLAWNKHARQVYVVYKAECNKGSTSKSAVVGSVNSDKIAIYAKKEGNAFLCVNN